MQDTPTPLTPVPPPPSMQQTQRKRTRWWIPVAIIGGLLVLLIVVLGVIMSVFVASIGEFGGKKGGEPIKKKTVLVLDLSKGVGEYDQPNPFAFGDNKNSTDLLDILQALKDAKTDDKIEGILIKAGGQVGSTKLTEIRDAVLNFKTSGKFVYAFMEAGSRQHYYLATAADSIFVPQEGMVEFNAFGATGMFFKQLSDKLGVSWHVEQFEEYKSAAEMTSRENWSAPAKQEVREIIEYRQQEFVRAVAQGRKLDTAEVTRLMNEGLYVADSLLSHKLIDGFYREDELKEMIARKLDPTDSSAHPKLRTTNINAYAARDHDSDDEVAGDRGIAIVYATGAISGGSGSGDGIYSRTLIKNLRKAADNKDVEAILLRIDSPGGSAIASDDIWSTIKEIRKTKPVYASMSDVAASGGYYIAMACDTIIAHPSTITGSIGVIMAIPNISGTLGKIGITIDTISMGASSHFMNGSLPYNPADQKKLHELGSGIYHRFVERVAESRKKDFESTRLLARGRVWTGQAALANGLVDVSGGFLDALKLIKQRIGVKPDEKVPVYVYPEKMELVEIILKMLNIKDNDDDEDASMVHRATLTQLLNKAVSPGMPVEQLWNTMPEGTKQQFRHAAATADIGKTEHAMVMMPWLITSD